MALNSGAPRPPSQAELADLRAKFALVLGWLDAGDDQRNKAFPMVRSSVADGWDKLTTFIGDKSFAPRDDVSRQAIRRFKRRG